MGGVSSTCPGSPPRAHSWCLPPSSPRVAGFHEVTGFLPSLAVSAGRAGKDMGRGVSWWVRQPGLGAVLGLGRPHLHRAVAQLDGLVDALHDLVEACGGQRTRVQAPPSSPCPSHTHREVPELLGASGTARVWAPDSKYFRLCKPRDQTEALM